VSLSARLLSQAIAVVLMQGPTKRWGATLLLLPLLKVTMRNLLLGLLSAAMYRF
jgi:hypothetical protein